MPFAAAIVALVFAGAACAEAQTLDLSGDLSMQGRWYPQSPAFPGQRASTGGMVVETTLYAEAEEGTSFTVTPLYRYDSADSRRTHADLREAYVLMHGDWGENSWELRLGVDRVFWGVAELDNLVDIVNQSDLVAHPRDRPKLGQPMARLTIGGDWGIAETLVLPFHRKRTFPGQSGRHRSGRSIDDNPRYESGAKERHVDLAARYGNAVGLLDFGVSAFAGTSREPLFLFGHHSERSPAVEAPLTPYYEQIWQLGIDAQLTTEPWLYKTEGMCRGGSRNLLGEEEDFCAVIFGLERTLYGVFGTRADLTAFAEWHFDGRGRRATNVRANDVYAAGVLALNDLPGTEIVAGLLGDFRHEYRALNLELRRRLSNRWLLRVETSAILSSDPRDPTYDSRRDSFLGVDFTFSF